MLTLHEALTSRLIYAAQIDGSMCWTCSKCGQYLVYYLGRYHFVCSCCDDKLQSGV